MARRSSAVNRPPISSCCLVSVHPFCCREPSEDQKDRHVTGKPQYESRIRETSQGIVLESDGAIFMILRSLLKPIPRLRSTSAVAYRSVPIRHSKHSSDSLVALQDYGVCTEPYYARTDGLNAPYYRSISGAEAVLKARREVVGRLTRVNRRLKQHGVELLALDAYRLLECQRGLWNFFVDKAKTSIRLASQAAAENYALKFCSDPRNFDRSDPRTWPTHLTGGAVDVTLKSLAGRGESLYMGGIFDDPSGVSKTDYFERHQRTGSCSDLEARANRRLLYWAMAAEGFANLPTEWWHYDWGTQRWALEAVS